MAEWPLLPIIARLTATYCNLSPDREMVIVVFKGLTTLAVDSIHG